MLREDEWEGFEWDEGNSTKNWLKHGITISECEEVFMNERSSLFSTLSTPNWKHD
jgi:uncharacterized DUF497 family protein